MKIFLKNTVLLIVGIGIIFSLQLTNKSTFSQQKADIFDLSEEEEGKSKKDDVETSDFLADLSSSLLNLDKLTKPNNRINDIFKNGFDQSPLTSPPNV